VPSRGGSSRCRCRARGVIPSDPCHSQSRNAPKGIRIPVFGLKLLNKLSVSELAELTNLSKSYISHVRHGRRPPSQRLLDCLNELERGNGKKNGQPSAYDSIEAFLQSRREGASPGTIEFYAKYLSKAVPVLGLTPRPTDINRFVDSLSCTVGGKHAYFRAMSVYYNWLYSPRAGLGFSIADNPFLLVDAPKRPTRIPASLTREQVEKLLAAAQNPRDKAIISLFTESGLRLSELLAINTSDIHWETHTIRVIGKGNKEAYAPFGSLSERHLRTWLAQFKPKPGQSIWNLGYWGIKTMLNNLRKETGISCQPHTFRRTFACLLRKAGVDTMTIKDLGRWESLEMVQRYTRSVTFQDSLRFYKAPLS
jgi:site-specific recombinase XerD